MPQTNEVLELAKAIGLSSNTADNQAKENNMVASTETISPPTTENHNEQPQTSTNDSSQTIVATGNSSVPSSSSSSSSSSSLSISSSGKQKCLFSSCFSYNDSTDIDEFYDDPSDLLTYELASNNNIQVSITHPQEKSFYPLSIS